VTHVLGLRRWFSVWLVLLVLSCMLVRYFDSGPPASWSGIARAITECFLVPGGIIWTALFWHVFGSGPTVAGRVFIVLVNSTIWVLAVYATIRSFRWLCARMSRRSKT
jgi:hypothetical protein